jgi:hypothetical protein
MRRDGSGQHRSGFSLAEQGQRASELERIPAWPVAIAVLLYGRFIQQATVAAADGPMAAAARARASWSAACPQGRARNGRPARPRGQEPRGGDLTGGVRRRAPRLRPAGCGGPGWTGYLGRPGGRRAGCGRGRMVLAPAPGAWRGSRAAVREGWEHGG